ncbi:MAG: hypothetical protein HY791_12940 [Deltaproteobacteria bacterium]|nr:hypothetical protein [Deltaproteobacteria bacterium]
MSTRLDALCSALGLGPGADPILELVRALYAELDEDLEARTGDLRLPCKAGCDACCHESVFLSAPELLLAVRSLWENGPSEVQRVTDEMCALAERFADELELLETVEGDERDEVALRVRFRCPLLVSSRCSIYRGRELNARTFGASLDSKHGVAYGCELTREHLVTIGVIGERLTRLPGAREARARLAEKLPGTERAHVYPWWFQKYREWILVGPP